MVKVFSIVNLTKAIFKNKTNNFNEQKNTIHYTNPYLKTNNPKIIKRQLIN